MSCFAEFGDINAIPSMSVLPLALFICVYLSLFQQIRLSCFCIFLSIGPEGFLWAHPKDSSFELKSPTNMTSVERLFCWFHKPKIISAASNVVF